MAHYINRLGNLSTTYWPTFLLLLPVPLDPLCDLKALFSSKVASVLKLKISKKFVSALTLTLKTLKYYTQTDKQTHTDKRTHK